MQARLLQLGAGIREVGIVDVELEGTALSVHLLVLRQLRSLLLQLPQLLPQLLDLEIRANAFCFWSTTLFFYCER